MDILVASNNHHKIEELSLILPGHHLIPVNRYLEDFDPEETGSTFLENSLIKSRSLFHRLSPEDREILAVLADDSGLSVDALNGRPGIYSSRFGHHEAGRTLSSEEQNSLLLEKLAGLPPSRRSARYICCMSLILDSNRIYTAQESWEGRIAATPSSAAGGFGYDPIFWLPGKECTVADISAEEKRLLSHRGKAARAIAAMLPDNP
ncbi:non-canonical purine NTP pyrophosphatase [Salinispira pacifica]|uniref:dITP/XTP pyrophosphatase n=1 Tax=Salinispira pacifica TaxID=1307761 RepID=V5WKZ1_9SPIO|nr:non-canonical purine NTP pyrophosphatase [Salinispira pacifica]AHC15861.1 Nucleoside 5-triphosphatase RdgB (dHAPTP, dITP, XTP-specific) [Salinispira pacifica]